MMGDLQNMAQTKYAAGGMMEVLAISDDRLHRELVAAADAVSRHPLFEALHTMEHARRFMNFHVWCVWDFMCIAKSVQLSLGCFELPWKPTRYPYELRLINKLLTSEETDLPSSGRPASHFELFLEAMAEASADTGPIKIFIHLLNTGGSVNDALYHCGADRHSATFVKRTLTSIAGPAHVRAAILCLAREELVPRMLSSLSETFLRLGSLAKFRQYVDRHVALDFGEHGSIGADILRSLTRPDPALLEEGIRAATQSIIWRHEYLDNILANIKLIDADCIQTEI